MVNQEIIDSSKNILDVLDSKGLLDTPERKAKAKELIEKYQKSNVEFIKWETAHAVKHPSWHVTGRSNRNMSKYNDAQDRHMRQFSSKVDALTEQRKRITSSVESVMNDQQKAAKKEKSEESLKKRMEGEVIRGDQRGRELGFPTANMSIDGLHPPKFGVYAVKITVRDGPFAGDYNGAASIGVRPMFGENLPNLESYIFDFKGDIYGEDLSVALVEYLRPEAKFENLEALITQMNMDCAKAREILHTLQPP